MKRMLAKVKSRHEVNPKLIEAGRFRAKISGVTSQIDALSERLSELPKGISAAPIYKQLEKLQLINKENEETLLRFKNEGVGSLNRIVGLDTFENFASNYRNMVTQNLDVTQKATRTEVHSQG